MAIYLIHSNFHGQGQSAEKSAELWFLLFSFSHSYLTSPVWGWTQGSNYKSGRLGWEEKQRPFPLGKSLHRSDAAICKPYLLSTILWSYRKGPGQAGSCNWSAMFQVRSLRKALYPSPPRGDVELLLPRTYFRFSFITSQRNLRGSWGYASNTNGKNTGSLQ